MTSGDLRVLSVVYDYNGERFREFSDAVQKLEEFSFPGTPVKGPLTFVWAVRFMRANAGTPTGWHTKWKALTKLQDSDAGVAMHEVSCRLIEVMLYLNHLDHLVTMFLDEMFFRGRSSRDGSRLLAALKNYIPAISRFGTEALPRSRRALQSWTKAAPGMQRLPLPPVLFCAMLGHMMFHNRGWTAVKLFVHFRTYMRPGVCDGLLVSQLVPPTQLAGSYYNRWGFILNPTELGIPGKTGLWDEAVFLDTDPWMPSIFQALSQQPPRSPLWPVSAIATIDHFNFAVLELGLQELHPSRYSLRHGGASDDLLSRRRTVNEV